jgi:Fe-Mn family superoxide dismutase
MAPTGTGGGRPGGKIGDIIDKEFGSFDRFKKEFSMVANSVEGSGWAAMVFCGHIKRPQLVQIEKHNVNVTPQQKHLLVLDVWEHAYYLDYKNDRGKFVESWWNLVNWDEVEKRLP